ncbi:hypothetical protein pVco14_082 [Vibrio phage pVco-14]|nr:hypothetical protein pVco14_082 [Vibrio phage pVco-14]
MTIILQHQPDNITCVSACAAMLMGRPVDTVVDEFHDDFQNFYIELDSYLAKHGVHIKRTVNRQFLDHGKVYVLLVPSLNSPAHFHQVLADTRGGKVTIYDPARKGCQRYVGPGQALEPGETEIITWVIDYEVICAPAIGVQ